MKNARIVILTMLFIAFAALPIFNAAAENARTNEISYGIEVLKEKTKLRKSAPKGTGVGFSSGEFEEAAGKNIDHITVVTLPDISDGILKIGGVDVIKGQSVSKENIGYLKFIPRSASTKKASFLFTGTSSADSRALECFICFYDDENSPPVSANKEVSTYKNITVYGAIEGVDRDGDEISYSVISSPEHGFLDVSEDGRFTYRPYSDFAGRDSFSYVSYDVYGNRSEAASVSIKVEKPYKNVYFTDMTDHWAHASAVSLVKNRITSVTVSESGTPVFDPDKRVTRGDFLVMAMKATGLDVSLKETDYTNYADDSAISYSMKRYVSRAGEMGIIKGVEKDGKTYFLPDETITRAQAAVILNRILDLPTGDAAEVFADRSQIPAWAESSVNNLVACGIMSGQGNGILNPEGELTNAQCAALLMNVVNWKSTNG